MMKHLIGALVVLCHLMTCGQSYKILLLSIDTRGHMILFTQLGKALMSHGHDVTMVLGSSMEITQNLIDSGINIEQYQSNKITDAESLEGQYLVMNATFNPGIQSYMNLLAKVKAEFLLLEDAVFDDEDFVSRLRKGQFDFAVIDMPIATAFYYLVYDLGIPYASIGIDCSPWMYKIPWFPSYVPNYWLPGYFYDDMNLWQKTLNTLVYFVSIPISPGQGRVGKFVKHRPEINLVDIVANTSLCMQLSTPVLKSPRPTVPNVIDVGGLMASPGQSLPNDIDVFLSTSKYGVVLVCFGTWLNQLPDDVILRMLEAFKKVKYDVLWKYGGSLAFPVPSNIKLMTWVPQNDVLAHPRLKCFVSHCGQSSVLEAVYHGTPIVGIPLVADQPYSARTLQQMGLLRMLDVRSFTSEELVDAINGVIEGPESGNMKRTSAIFKDLPSGGDVASYWIEHVIKHGSKHLQIQAVHMPWYQYLMLDVVAVFIMLFSFLTMICLCCCMYTFKYCRICVSRSYDSFGKFNNVKHDKEE